MNICQPNIYSKLLIIQSFLDMIVMLIAVSYSLYL